MPEPTQLERDAQAVYEFFHEDSDRWIKEIFEQEDDGLALGNSYCMIGGARAVIFYEHSHCIHETADVGASHEQIKCEQNRVLALTALWARSIIDTDDKDRFGFVTDAQDIVICYNDTAERVFYEVDQTLFAAACSVKS